MLTFDDTTFGTQQCELNLAELYPETREKSEFLKRLKAFVESDEDTQSLIFRSGNTLQYTTEVFAINRIDDRPPLLLLVGNPASHSVVSGFCFACEKGGREHRFWKGLRETGILTFFDQVSMENRREAFRDLQYASPFLVSIAVFYSLPSPASANGWSGVSGVRKLLGARAFREVAYYEEKRIQNLVFRFIQPAGSIIAFQKDAYEGLRMQDSPAYSRDRAKQGALIGRYKLDENIPLAGSPPTRLMQSKSSKQVLEKYKNRLLRPSNVP